LTSGNNRHKVFLFFYLSLLKTLFIIRQIFRRIYHVIKMYLRKLHLGGMLFVQRLLIFKWRMEMKKVSVLFLIILVMAFIVSGCSKPAEEAAAPDAAVTEEAAPAPDAAAPAEEVAPAPEAAPADAAAPVEEAAPAPDAAAPAPDAAAPAPDAAAPAPDAAAPAEAPAQ
jgi:hypothetical protein